MGGESLRFKIKNGEGKEREGGEEGEEDRKKQDKKKKRERKRTAEWN